MLKKVDLFQANKEMSKRVEEFMRTKVWGITLKARCKKEIETAEKSIEGLEKLKGSILAENAESDILALRNHITELESKLAKQLKDEANFTFTDNDEIFFKSYKKGEDDMATIAAISVWFKVYGLEVDENTELVQNILYMIAGGRRANAKTVVCSDAKQFTEQKRTKNDVLGLFYGTLAEEMLRAGTLKPQQIPEDVRDMYAPKKKSK